MRRWAQIGEFGGALNQLFGRGARELIELPAVPIGPIWGIPAAEWNALVRSLARNHLLGALDIPGTLRDFTHPWHTTLAWDAAEEQWTARVRPGFVNGLSAEVRVQERDAPLPTLERLRRANLPRRASTAELLAWLTEKPLIRIPQPTWRIAGVEGEHTGPALPEFFTQTLGLVQGGIRTVIREEGAATTTSGTAAEQAQRVLVRVAYLTLSVDRISTNLSTDRTGNLVISYESPAGGNIPLLSVGRVPATPTDLTGLEGLTSLLSLLTAQTGQDRQPIASLYLVSPPGLPPGPDTRPDGSWRPYVQHHTFWNLSHTLSRPVADFVSTKLSLPVPIVGGDVVQGMLDQQNQIDAALAAQLSTQLVRGMFYGC